MKEQLIKFQQEFNLLIEAYFSKNKFKCRTEDKYIEDFILRGGKRLRPALFYYSYLLFSKKTTQEILYLSMLFEFIQTFFLIHDDVIDRDIIRRGKPTVHKMYEAVAKKSNFKDAKHYGISMAIIAGDISIMHIFNIIENSKIDNESKIKLFGTITRDIVTTLRGQIADIEIEYVDRYEEKDVENIQISKTGTYTFSSPIISGAILGGASEDKISLLRKFSTSAGIAFQIRDDVLNIFKDEKETGKSVAGDISEGKKTLLTFKFFENANNTQKKIFKKLFGKKVLSKKDVNEVRRLFVETKALRYSLEKFNKKIKYSNKLLTSLKSVDKNAFVFIKDVLVYLSDEMEEISRIFDK